MELMLLLGLIYLLIGTFAGLMAGMFGIGGGLIVVPGLVFVFQKINLVPSELLMHVAVGTSLAVMVITTQAAVRAHHKMGNVLWPLFHKLWPGLFVGTITGAVTAAWVPASWLKIFFALFLFLVAVKMLMDKDIEQSKQIPADWIIHLFTLFVGISAAMLGVGGGILIVPFMVYCRVPTLKIAAISNLCALTIAIIATIAFMITGIHETTDIAYMTGYIYWPAVFLVGIASSLFAPLGTKLHYILPVQQLKYGFIVLLVLTGLKMLL